MNPVPAGLTAIAEAKRILESCGVVAYLPYDVRARLHDMGALLYSDEQYVDGGYPPSVISEAIVRAEHFIADKVAFRLERA
jgi:hypothetical protein